MLETDLDAFGDHRAVDLVQGVIVDSPGCCRGAAVERDLARAEPGEVVVVQVAPSCSCNASTRVDVPHTANTRRVTTRSNAWKAAIPWR